jgi:hypothetical protein
MKTIIATALEAIGGDRIITNTKGWTLGEGLMATAEAQLDSRRFGGDLVESILARYGEDEGALYPEASELAARGADLFALNNAAVNGLDMVAFGEACEEGLDVAVFTRALNRGLEADAATELLVSYEASTLNGHLENFCEAVEEHDECPDAAERAFKRIDGAGVAWQN